MIVHGACHCGAIAYEAEIDPAAVSVCHCTDCQTLSGAPFRASAPAKAENFHLLRGSPTIYVKTAQSGNRRAQGFCGACGSPLYSTDAVKPLLYMLRLGTLAEREHLAPQRQIWCGAAAPWTRDILDLPAKEQQ